MSWQGANVSRRKRSSLSPDRQRRSSETVEASLSRLSKSYSAALECVGACHRASQEETGTTLEQQQETRTKIQQVARTARKTLERAILIDPFVRDKAEGLMQIWQAWSKETKQSPRGNTWSWVSSNTRQIEPPELTSAAHRATVQKLAYLALTNYADLLLSGCSCCCQGKTDTILDRGVVTPLFKKGDACCCWVHEELVHEGEEQSAGALEIVSDTVRLAMVSYMDAVLLDGSDPTMWFKLAAAARRLENLRNDHPRRYKKVEQYALENAQACWLTQHRPPNRLIARAWEEWQETYGPDAPLPDNFDASPQENEQEVLQISLPRYSWAVLGRNLSRACREGTSFHNHTQHHGGLPVQASGRISVKPIIHLNISPMLTLPSSVLGQIIDFLDGPSVARLEFTCRALSVMVLAARARADYTITKKKSHQQQQDNEEAPIEEERKQDDTAEKESLQTDTQLTQDPKVTQQEPPTPSKKDKFAQGSRVSKRLLTKIESSDKKAERSSRRNSVEYCLVGAVLGVSTESKEYLDQLQFHQEKKPQDSLQQQGSKTPQQIMLLVNSEKQGLQGSEREALERVSPASLCAFVNLVSERSSTPLSALFQFVAHVSLYVDEVYAHDSHGPLVLSTCIMDVFELLMRRSKIKGLVPLWCKREPLPAGALFAEMFAVDLLHAELRLKRCERDDSLDSSFDGDINFLTMALPSLLSIAESDEVHALSSDIWARLRARCYWLASNFILWQARATQGAIDIHVAEEECMQSIDKLLNVLQECDEVRTPHLEGVGRTGSYWRSLSKESLNAFKSEIQASSVVLAAQDNFVDAVSKLDPTDFAHNESQCQRALKPIGDSLLERYKHSKESLEANHIELIEDFLAQHGSDLMGFSISDTSEIRAWFRKLIPVDILDVAHLQSIDNPCLLTILAVCLSFRSTDGHKALLEILVNLVGAIGKLRHQLEISDFPTARKRSEEMSDDEMSLDSDLDSTSKAMDSEGLQLLYSRFLALLLILVAELIDKILPKDLGKDVLKPEETAQLVKTAFSFVYVKKQFHHTGSHKGDEMTESAFVFLAASDLVASMRRNLIEGVDWLVRLHVNNLVDLILFYQHGLESWNKNATNLSKTKCFMPSSCELLLIRACSDLGELLSQALCPPSGMKITRPPLLIEIQQSIASLCKSLLWLWKKCQQNGDAGKSVFSQASARKLKLPVGAAVVALCGSASFTRNESEIERLESESDISLMDVVDSDASTAGCVSDEDFSYEEMMRVAYLAVQCVHLLFESIAEGEEVTGTSEELLPRVSERVLNFFADLLLVNPNGQDSDADGENPLWSDYTYGARTVGAKIDKLLHRVYKALYGFNLAQSGEIKDTVSSPNDETKHTMKPANLKATVHLYRCVMRTCQHGRKSAPKAALRTITDSLPSIQETEQSRTLERFLFSSERTAHLTSESIIKLMNKTGDWESPFEALDGLWANNSLQKLCGDDAEIIRRGLSDLFAQGTLPSFEGTVDKDTRAQTEQLELELSNRFEAILYGLTHNNCSDCEGWFRLSQLCLLKANMIADRLGMSNGFSRSHDFQFDAVRQTQEKGLPLSQLIEMQERESETMKKVWNPTLGSDLRIYIDNSWSSFDSLKALQRKLGQDCTRAYQTCDESSDLKTWNEIAGFYTEGELALWQQAWGGLFVRSLQIMGTRCTCLALFILQKGIGFSDSIRDNERRSDLIAEICESFATNLYSELIGSQMYGYPMQAMTKKDKRDIAQSALACYKLSVEEEEKEEAEDADNPKKKKDLRMTWDLHFMVGKCHEKIASTYKGESFGLSESREYEKNMTLALHSYAGALFQAQSLDKDGTLVVEQQGGSGHGATEVLYRLHATRLKCLLSALKHCDKERDQAELEGLRLTEPLTFEDISGEVSNASVRDRVWNVAIDIVSAMANCRTKHSCFHRSVYRHAQALMWAPVLCDPEGSRKKGSRSPVPMAKAFKMRGLNSVSAVESATIVMRALFDKKRAQLCAVWVTTSSAGSDSPLERLNLDSRKYDSLRGKYVSAFLICLQLCHRRDELETFMRWTTTCKRDLPSYFAASAYNGGKNPETSHNYDTLILKPSLISSRFFLTSAKREANAALAAVILHEMSTLKSPRDPKELENKLKLAYSCFLRLNCTPSLLSKPRIRQSPGVKPVADALVAVHARMTKKQATNYSLNDWSMDRQKTNLVEVALQKCSALFPALSGSFLTSKRNPKKKKTGEKEENNSKNNNQVAGSKRKEPDGSFTILEQFTKTIPEGLKEGDTFLTEIQSGNKVKRIRLTVPPGDASTLRFSLRVALPSEEKTQNTSESEPMHPPIPPQPDELQNESSKE